MLALAACLLEEKVGDTGSNMSSNRICFQFIALYKTCFVYTLLNSHSSCTCSGPTQWTVTNASCVMMDNVHVARRHGVCPLHMQN